MKIGIISINAHTKVLNFASPLHSYAFWSFLKEHGIESTIIDYLPAHCRNFDPRHPLFHYIDHPKAGTGTQKRLLKKWKDLFYEREYRYDRFEEFIQKYYKKTDICYTAKMMKTEDPGFDCYICATDVIWKYRGNKGFDKGFLLACKQMKKKKKIAYAASPLPKNLTAEWKKYFFNKISDFDYLSVREKSLMEFIRQNSDLPVTHVLDPVFLREKEFYSAMAIPPEKKGYVLIYIVMEKAKDIVKAAVSFAAAHNLEVIELSEDLENADFPKGTHHEVLYGLGVEEWLGYMQHANYIFTNSFHACCFSIIFGKQFFVGDRHGDKIESLLEMFCLSGRWINGISSDMLLKMPDIDYGTVNTRKQELIEVSSSFILNAIHDLENSSHQKRKYLVHKEIYTNKTPFWSKQKLYIKKKLKKLYIKHWDK